MTVPFQHNGALPHPPTLPAPDVAGGYVRIYRNLVTEYGPRLGARALAVYLWLFCLAEWKEPNAGTVKVSTRELAALTLLARNTVREALNKLERERFIHPLKRGARTVSIYRLAFWLHSATGSNGDPDAPASGSNGDPDFSTSGSNRAPDSGATGSNGDHNNFTVSVRSFVQSVEVASDCVVSNGKVGPPRCVENGGSYCGECSPRSGT
jgi:hypothetical protein